MKFPFGQNISERHKSVTIGSLRVDIFSRTRFTFMVPFLEITTIEFVRYDKRLLRFSHIIFEFEDSRPFPKVNLRRLLPEIWHMPTESIATIIVGDANRDYAGAVSYIGCTVHVNVNVIIKDAVNVHAPWLLETIISSKELEPETVREIVKVSENKQVEVIIRALTHEFTHVLHNLSGVYAKRAERAKKKRDEIAKRIAIHAQDIETAKGYGELVTSYRFIIELILLKLFSEGIATYYEQWLNNNDLFWNPQQAFEKLYIDAYSKWAKPFFVIKNLARDLSPSIFKNDRSIRAFHGLVSLATKQSGDMGYSIGLHMAFTIQSVFRLGDKLLELGIGEYIRYYEEACSKWKVEPLISLSNGKGKLFDYKEMLRSLHQAEKRA